MKRTIIVALLTAVAVSSARASLGSSLRTWLEHVKEGLAESSVSGQRQRMRVSAVAAVRGAEQRAMDPEKPIWKSSSADKKARALRAERAELAAIVDAALAGKLDDAQSRLDAFESAHPSSPLLADAKEIRAHLTDARPTAQ